MGSASAYFDDMDTAKGSSSGTFFTTGVYTVALKEVEWIPDGYKGTSCKFHLAVKATNNEEHPVGQTRVWILKFDKKEQKERSMADIKSLLFALLGFDPRPLKNPDSNPKLHKQASMLFKALIDPEFAEANDFVAKAKAMIGKECLLEAEVVATKGKPPENKPGQFTRHAWGPVPKAA